MLDGLARKFFWTTVASGFLAYGSGFTRAPAEVNKFVKEVREFKKPSIITSMTSSSLGEKPRLNAPGLNGMKAPEYQPQEVKYNMNGKEYVLIEGRYYEYRKDHVYMVNGKKVFYFNDRARTALPESEKVLQAQAMAEAPAVKPAEPVEIVNDDTIMSPSEAVRKLRELQQQMKERDSFLNNVGDEFKTE